LPTWQTKPDLFSRKDSLSLNGYISHKKTEPSLMTIKSKSANKTGLPEPFESGGIFEIEIKELLEDHWQKWFEGMTLIRVENDQTHKGFTTIRCYIPDQPALHGLLDKVRDLNLTLLSVQRIDARERSGKKKLRRRRSAA
jgi:hypothetical protein